MQKFTKALTREIEIGGERLAVTLAAEGVTIRPVGSRRPPLTLSWAAILCAGTGASGEPTEAAVTSALAALEGKGVGTAPVARSLAATSSSGDLSGLLKRLDTWLRKHRGGYHEALLPGADAGELAGLATVIGREVPEELKEWLNWHNGQDEEVIGSFIESWNLMSATQIASAWQERQSEGGPTWNDDWIPLLDDYQGDLIVLDPTRPGCAVRGVWRGQKEAETVAPTLEAWLEAFVRDVEAGRYEEDPERGEFHRI